MRPAARGGLVLLVIGAAVLLALLGGWRGGATGDAPSAPALAAAVPPALAPAAAAGSAPAAVPTAAPSRPDSPWKVLPVELCGVGSMPVTVRTDGQDAQPSDPDGLPPHLGRYAMEASRAELLQALATGPTRWQAGAAVMGGRDAVAALRQVALAGTDVVALQWAVSRCGDDLPCSAEPLARWLAVEPDNLAPWLFLWHTQPQRREEALAGLRRATRYRAGWAQLTDVVLQALPPHTAPYLQVPWVVETIGLDAAMQDPTLFTLGKLCRPPPEPGSRRQADCDRWAQLLVEQGDTLMAVQIGLRLGELAGWPPERTEPQRQALRDLQAHSGGVFDVAQPFGCAGVQRVSRWARQVAREGEVAALRSLAAASAAAR